jgi:hypothetical protein
VVVVEVEVEVEVEVVVVVVVEAVVEVVAVVAEAEVEVEVEVAEAAEGAEAAFRGTAPEMRPSSRSQSIQKRLRIGSSQLQAPSLLWT